MMEWGAAVLLVLGSAFMLIAAGGVARFPDLLTRMHAAAKAGSVGVGLMVAAVAVHFREEEVTIEAVLIGSFVLLTAPVAAHMIARAAYLSGVPLWEGTIVDELRLGRGRPPRPGRGGASRGAAPRGRRRAARDDARGGR